MLLPQEYNEHMRYLHMHRVEQHATLSEAIEHVFTNREHLARILETLDAEEHMKGMQMLQDMMMLYGDIAVPRGNRAPEPDFRRALDAVIAYGHDTQVDDASRLDFMQGTTTVRTPGRDISSIVAYNYGNEYSISPLAAMMNLVERTQAAYAFTFNPHMRDTYMGLHAKVEKSRPGNIGLN